jgi:hypothetical protein
MIHILSAPGPARRTPEVTREAAPAAAEVPTWASARQYKVLQSRSAPAQLALPLGGITISPPLRHGTAGKPFRTV